MWGTAHGGSAGGGTGAAGQVSRDAREHGLYPTGKSETIEIFLKMR